MSRIIDAGAGKYFGESSWVNLMEMVNKAILFFFFLCNEAWFAQILLQNPIVCTCIGVHK